MFSRICRASLAAACLALVCAPAMAQTNDVVQQKDINAQTLINALTPAKPTPAPVEEPAAASAAAAAASGEASVEAGAAGAEHASFRTRSFKLAKPHASPSKGPAKTAKASASASLMITFETDSARLTSESKLILGNLGAALASEKLASFKFNIEGHADSRGDAGHNLKLSEERAQMVRQYLISQHQIDGARLIALGKGDAEQLNPGNPAAPENRRVRVVTITE